MAIESYFEDIADAIRERGGTSATLTPAQMPKAILDIPGGSGNSYFKYNAVDFYGDIAGEVTLTLTINYTIPANKKFLLIIMHRDNITLSDNTFQFVRKDQNGSYSQWISIYEKTVSTDVTGSLIVNQTTSVRMAACSFIFNSNISIGNKTTQPYDSTVIGEPAIRTIQPSDEKRLIVFSDAWSISTSEIRYMEPVQLALPFNYINTSTKQARLFAFIPNALTNIVYNPQQTLDADVIANNAMNIYELMES